MREKCDQCLFTPQRIVSAARVQEIVAEAEATDTHFVCHKSSIAGGNAACAGWYYSGRTSKTTRFLAALGEVGFSLVEFIDPPKGDPDV